MMASQQQKPLMRCLGEFVGHILHAVKGESKSHRVSKKVEEHTNGNVTLRRTTIDEIEIQAEDIRRD